MRIRHKKLYIGIHSVEIFKTTNVLFQDKLSYRFTHRIGRKKWQIADGEWPNFSDALKAAKQLLTNLTK